MLEVNYTIVGNDPADIALPHVYDERIHPLATLRKKFISFSGSMLGTSWTEADVRQMVNEEARKHPDSGSVVRSFESAPPMLK